MSQGTSLVTRLLSVLSYRNKSANSGQCCWSSEFGTDSDTNKIYPEKFWRTVKYCNHREKYQIPNWMIRYLLEMSPQSRVTCLFVYPVLVNSPHSRHVCIEKLTQSDLSRRSMIIFIQNEGFFTGGSISPSGCRPGRR